MTERFDVDVYEAVCHPRLWNIRFFPKSLKAKHSIHETAARPLRLPLVIADYNQPSPALVLVPGDWQDEEIAPADYKAEAIWQIEHRHRPPCHTWNSV